MDLGKECAYCHPDDFSLDKSLNMFLSGNMPMQWICKRHMVRMYPPKLIGEFYDTEKQENRYDELQN